MQLFHGGREQISAAPRAPAVAPSAVPSPRFACEPRALTAAELRALVDGYATAARHCREGGVDGIEVSMSHGYLIAQFFSPRSNRRRDEYGAAAGGRLRFAEEVLAAVREAAGPELAVGVRLAADELAPDGLDGAACAEIARRAVRDRAGRLRLVRARPLRVRGGVELDRAAAARARGGDRGAARAPSAPRSTCR